MRALRTPGLVWFLIGTGLASIGVADELHLSARQLMDRSIARHVVLNTDATAITLDRGELFSDDGPAAGYSYKPNEETLTDGVRVRKDLMVDDPRTDKAFLLIGSTGTLNAEINGRSITLSEPARAGNYWQSFSIPPDSLKSGLNKFVLAGRGKLWIARDDEFAAGAEKGESPPNRSARSVDGGTWNYDRLGTRGDLDGEYCARLFLDRYRKSGSLTLPVVDLANLEEATIGPVIAELPRAVRITCNLEVTTGARLAIRARSGTKPVPDTDTWTDWQPVAEKGEVPTLRGRYCQFELTFSTDDPRQSPRLTQLMIASEPKPASDWPLHWKPLEDANPRVVRSSIPFRYEPFDHPRLKQFREERRLDDVVAGATGEIELMERLAVWSSRQWDAGHLGQVYPPWDALAILAPHADGKPVGGFCQQYNLVFLQACESFGIPGRCVSIGSGDHGINIRSGHEVVELWSNDHRKWVYIDGNAAWYFRDAMSRVPLSLRELRERQLAAIRKEPSEPVEFVELAKTRYEWKDITGWPAFAELRLIPRSNFLEQRFPVPLNQGMRGWFWTGHEAWTDAAYPASMLYGRRVSQPANWDWTLNHAHILLEATETPDVVRVHLDSETPGFETYLATIDDGEPRAFRTGDLWKLHAGKNSLSVRPRNIAGREGAVSKIVLTDAVK